MSALVNSSPNPQFYMEYGLKQGCPLSPMFFNLVAKAFPILVSHFQSKGNQLQGVYILGLPKTISTTQYVYDNILFFCRSTDLSNKVQEYLTIFTMIYGLKINLHKNSILVVGQNIDTTAHIATDLGYQTASISFMYFGLPIGGRILDYNSLDHVVGIF